MCFIGTNSENGRHGKLGNLFLTDPEVLKTESLVGLSCLLSLLLQKEEGVADFGKTENYRFLDFLYSVGKHISTSAKVPVRHTVKTLNVFHEDSSCYHVPRIAYGLLKLVPVFKDRETEQLHMQK